MSYIIQSKKRVFKDLKENKKKLIVGKNIKTYLK